MKFFLFLLTILAFITTNLQAAAITGYTLIYPETGQEVILFGDHHHSHIDFSSIEADSYVSDMIEILSSLHNQGYKVYCEPGPTESPVYNEKIASKFPDNSRIGYVLKQIIKQFTTHNRLFFAHDAERAGIGIMLLTLKQAEYYTNPEIEENMSLFLQYLSVAAARFRENFVSLQYVRHLPKYDECLQSIDSLLNVIIDENANRLKAWIAHGDAKWHINNIIIHVADLTTLNHILSIHSNAVIYVGFVHAFNLIRILQKSGFVVQKKVEFIDEITGCWDPVPTSELATNRAYAKQWLCCLLDYQDMTIEQLRKINLLARLMTNIKRLQIAQRVLLELSSSEYVQQEDINKIFNVIATCLNVREKMSRAYLVIDPAIFVQCPARTQTAAEERLVNFQRTTAQEEIVYLRDRLQFALHNIDLVYQWIPGLNGILQH